MRTRGALVLLLAGLVAATLATPVAAQDGGDDRLVEDLDALAETYNENLDSVPGVFQGQLSNERVDIRVTTDDGEQRYYAETGANARVTEIERGEGDRSPTVRVHTDEETLDAIRSSETPAETAVAAYDDGDIRITGAGPVDTVRVEAVKAAVGVGRFLGLV